MGNNILQKRGLSACTPVSVLNRSDDKAVWRCGSEDESNIRTDIFACCSNIYHKCNDVHSHTPAYEKTKEHIATASGNSTGNNCKCHMVIYGESSDKQTVQSGRCTSCI